MAPCDGYQFGLCLLLLPGGNSLYVIKKIRQHRQCLFCLGNIGASMEVAYSASKGAVNSFTKSTGKRACPKQYPGKCRCIWYDRHPYEFLFFCGRTDCFRRRNPDRTLRHNRRSCRMYLPPCNCPGISDRTDPNHGWRLVLKTSHFLSLRISEKRKPLTYPCQRLPSLFVPSCFSALFSF